MVMYRLGIDRAKNVLAKVLSIAFIVALASGCASAPYFEPSASWGEVGYPAMTGSAYGIFPKNTIYFSPTNYPVIRVWATALTDHNGNPFRLDVQVSKLYWSDPRINDLPYDQAKSEIANDREEVVADASHVEIDWSSGKKQTVPLSFSEEIGSSKFVISGEPRGPGGAPAASAMNIALENDGSIAFDVKIPAMSFSGHRLEFPIIHFRRVD